MNCTCGAHFFTLTGLFQHQKATGHTGLQPLKS